MKENKDKKISLKVVEAMQDDAYKGIARIDLDTMKQLDIKRGDVIYIKGQTETVAIVDRAYPADMGENIIRIDGILRRNAKTSIGDMVLISKAEVKEATKIVIAPAQKGILVQADPNNLKKGLLGRALIKGDVFVLGGVQRRKDLFSEEMGGDLNDMLGGMLENMGFGGAVGNVTQIKFKVVSINPNKPVIITDNTEVGLSSSAVDADEDSVPDINYEDIGGLSDEIKKIREMVEIPMKHPEIFQKLGVEPPKGVLLHGPPGTGKTLLAKAVASETESNFILLNGPEIMSKFYGESEKKIRNIFKDAEENSPSIIFIDEIDAIAPKREDTHGEVERRVVSQLLTMMDGLKSRGKVVVIGATNRINALDPALRRPGRFDREIEVGVPDKNGRLAVLKIHTRGMPLMPPIKKVYIQEKINKLKEEIKNSKTKKVSNDFEKDEDIKIIKQEIYELENILDEISQEKINKLKEEIKNSKTKKVSNDFEKDEDIKIVNQEIYELESEFEKTLEGVFQEKKSEKYENENERILKLKFNKTMQEKIKNICLSGFLIELAGLTHGFVGADLESLTKEAAMNVLRRELPGMKLEDDEEIPNDVLDNLIVTQSDFLEALKVVRPSAMREILVENPNIRWEQVGGLDKVKTELKEAVEWPIKNAEAFSRMGIRPTRGLLLYGPPGTGKTLLAKAVASESEANFIHIKGPSLLSKWVNDSHKGIEKIFEKARQVAPCIIFFDEIESLAGKRVGNENASSQESTKVLNQLLAEMDGLEGLKDVLIIGATNRPDLLDPALLRPGRFDRVLLISTADEEGRFRTLKIHTAKTPLGEKKEFKEKEREELLRNLAKVTEGYTGADLEALSREAAMEALRENLESGFVRKEHFDMALEKVKPSVTKSTIETYKKIESEYLKSAKAAIPSSNSYLG